MERPKVLLAENDGYFRNNQTLNSLDTIEIVGYVKTGTEAIGLCQSLKPDILFVDMILKDMTGLEAARWIREQNSSIKIFLFSFELRLEFLRAGIEMEINGYLKKNNNPSLIEKAIEAARHGYFFVPNVVEEYRAHSIGG